MVLFTFSLPVLRPVVYRILGLCSYGTAGGVVQVLGSWVFSAGGGRGSVEAWHATALDIEDVLTGAADSDVHLFVADVINSFDTVDRGVLWIGC